MFRNYLKTTLRSFWKNKSFSFLNIIGLAVGIACAALIFLWVEDELAWNGNYAKKDQLYRVMENAVNKGQLSTSGGTPGPLAEAMKKEIPGIRETARLSWGMGQTMDLDDKSIRETGVYADPSLLSMLSMQFIYGDPQTALREPQSVVVNETLAKKFFGKENPVGKMIGMNAQGAFSVDGAFMITGVFKDIPDNASYSQYHWISPYKTFEDKNSWMKPWGNNLVETLAELEPSADAATVNKKLAGYIASKTGNTAAPKCFLFSMNDWKLRNHFVDGKPEGGDIKYVKLFSVIAIIILLIACINFMNLSTARSEQRAREIGVRKVMGAGKARLIGQFIGESVTMAFLAALLSALIVYLALPAYNALVGKDLFLHVFSMPHLLCLAGIALLTGLVAGSYPAFYLSSFNPIGTLKGARFNSGASVIFTRKGLVVTQFTISVVLIICTVIVYRQIQYTKQRDLGFNKDRLLEIHLQNQLKDHFAAVKEQLQATGFVENAAMSLHAPLHLYSFTDKYSWAGKDPNNKLLIHSNAVSPEYISTMHLQLISGRDFYANDTGNSRDVIINETLAKIMGKEGQPGGMLLMDTLHLRIAGVTRDFIFNDMFGPQMPALLFCNPSSSTSMVIRLRPGVDLAKALAATGAVMTANNPGFPFEFHFVDEEFDGMFISETRIATLASIFAVLAIFISCLGLFGLAAYMAERRTKEIGIRKVLGASATRIAGLLSRDFLQLVILSCLIAFPLAGWAMHSWLQNYEYRTTLAWWIFALAGISAIIIALITVSLQAARAALANPVKSLRTE